MSERDVEEYARGEDLGLDTLERRSDPRSGSQRRELRQHYGFLRGTFKSQPRKYAGLQRSLSQAHVSQAYDEYLVRSAEYALLAGLVGLLAGVASAFGLAEGGFLAGLRSPVGDVGGVGGWIGANRVLVAGVVLSILGTVVVAGSVWIARLRYPRLVVAQRRRAIDVTLPHAIVFMYALSHGGRSLYGVVTELAEAEDSYGEVAREFGTVVRDVELFGNDLYTALRNARNLTPSENLEQFLDDLLSVLDSGGDATVFFEDEADNYLDEAESQQKRFLETLAVLSEVFVVGFVAAPLFLIVILLVMSLLGASTLTQLGLIVYLVLPLGMAGYLLLIDYLSTPYKPESVRLERQRKGAVEGVHPWLLIRDVGVELRTGLGRVATRLRAVIAGAAPRQRPLAAARHDERDHARYVRRRRRRAFLAFLRRPLAGIRRRPDLSVVVTLPVALLTVGLVVATDTASLSLEALFAEPVHTTTWLGLVPLFIIAVPLSYFYERRRARQANIARRFPDILNILSSANRMGIRFVDALGLIARWSTGPIATELRLVRNDIEWNHDSAAALRSFADRLGTPQLSRTVRLISSGLRSSGDLSNILGVAAEDTRSRYRMERKRRSELGSYTAVVVIGFLVYLLVIILLSHHYLAPVAAAPAPPEIDGMTSPISFANVDVALYTALFFHSAVIQAIGSGLLAGKLVDNSVRSGLKYSLALLLTTVIAFAFI